MAEPESDRPEHPAAFFFIGAFHPAEHANFNIQNLRLPGEDAILEVFGHGVGVWWPSKTRGDFMDVHRSTRDWLESIAAIYYLVDRTALDVRLEHWVETLAHVDEAVLGFMDPRLQRIIVARGSEPGAANLRTSVDHVASLRGTRHALPAAREVWRAALDPTDDAFLSAFRALECIRRLYQQGDTDDNRKAAWKAMAADLLTVDEDRQTVLRGAAMAVRHGDRPTTRTEAHPINDARARRADLLSYATDLVWAKLRRLLKGTSKPGGA